MRLPVGSPSSTESAARSARRPASATSGPPSCRPLSKSELLCLLRSDSRAVSRKIELIVVHCTDTRPSQDFTLEKLKASHKARGFGDYPGYHLYVRRDGTLYYCRPLSIKGCHVAGHNAHSIGVCYEGGHKDQAGRVYEDNRTPAQKAVLRGVLRALREQFPQARICGHRDLNPNKACPCFDATAEYRTGNL